MAESDKPRPLDYANGADGELVPTPDESFIHRLAVSLTATALLVAIVAALIVYFLGTHTP